MSIGRRSCVLRRSSPLRSLATVAIAVAACSAPATLSDLKVAESRADAGDVDGAIAAYRRAQTSCKSVTPKHRAIAACSEALLGEAETLERADRVQPAIATYLAIPAKA